MRSASKSKNSGMGSGDNTIDDIDAISNRDTCGLLGNIRRILRLYLVLIDHVKARLFGVR